MRDWIFLALGILMLYSGGEVLIRSATQLAVLLRLSPLFIGLTIVALGTSAPELAATLVASFKGAGSVAFGNVIGSNIANLGLVLGLVALIRPLRTTTRFVTQEVPFMVFTGGLLMLVSRDGFLSRPEGLLFLVLLGLFLYVLMRRDSSSAIGLETKPAERPWSRLLLHFAGLVLGIGLLSWGADVLIEGAVGLAQRFGISQRVIGLTLVAVGTSLPELVSTLVAAYRRAGDIILGNVIGSNIMNVLAILGVTSTVKPFSFEREGVLFDLLTMMGFFFLTWLMLVHQRSIGRLKGLVLCGLYLVYVGFLYR
ncbi:MAG: calcium/sodium antiporter [Thermodesulfobacteria bacterium]|nr:calcium/sodium antiporter [Thermodesulfobacteriota bacterium]